MTLRLRQALACVVAASAAVVGLPSVGSAYTVYMVTTRESVAAEPGCHDYPGDCTLAEAITAANDNPGLDEILVPAQAGDPWVFHLTAPLPAITDALTLRSQGVCGYGTGPRRPVSEIDASALSSGAALTISGSATAGTTIWGFALTGAPGAGLRVDGAGRGSAICMRVGAHLDGTPAPNGGPGVEITATSSFKLGQENDPVTVFATQATPIAVSGSQSVHLSDGSAQRVGTAGPVLAVHDSEVLVGELSTTTAGRFSFDGGGPATVAVTGDAARVRVVSTPFSGGTGLPIDIGDDGVDANDAGDADTGPNTRLNTPSLEPVAAGATSVSVRLATAQGTHRIDVYRAADCGTDGMPRSLAPAGSRTVSVDGPGPYAVTLATPVQAGERLTAVVTAAPTNPTGASSEAARCVGPDSTPTTPDLRQVLFTHDHPDLGEQLSLLTPPSQDRQLVLGMDDGWANWSPAGDRIAYVNGLDLWLAEADGSAARRLVDATAAASEPVWAPDGLQVYFSEYGDAKAVDLRTGAIRTVLGGSATDTIVDAAADGQLLVFSNRTGVFRLYVHRADGTVVQQVRTDDGRPSRGTFSPDGRRVVFTDLTSGLVVADLDGAAPAAVRPALDGGNPDWAPDSDWVVYTTGTATTGVLWAVEVGASAPPLRLSGSYDAGGLPRWRPSGPGTGTPPTAAPDSYLVPMAPGRHDVAAPGVLGNDTAGTSPLAGIVVTDLPAPTAAVVDIAPTGALSIDTAQPGTHRFAYRAVDAQGRRSAPAEVTVTVEAPPPPDEEDPPVDLTDPASRQFLFYSFGSAGTGLWLGQRGVPPVRVLPMLSNEMAWYDWAPEGDRFAYVLTPEADLWVSSVDGRDRVRLTDGLDINAGVAFAPDGDTVYVAMANYDATPGIYAVRVSGGAPRRVAAADWADQPSDVSADGRTLLFSSQRTGETRMYTMDLATGAVRAIDGAVGGRGRYTADESAVAFNYRRGFRVDGAVVPVTGGTPVLLSGSVTGVAGFPDPAPDNPLVLSTDGEQPSLLHASTPGLQASAITLTTESHWASVPRWRPGAIRTGTGGGGGSDPDPVEAPEAVADAYTFVNGSPGSVTAPGVLENDHPGSSPLAAAVLASAGATPTGALQLAADGGLTWSTASSGTGTWTFTYRARDTAGRLSGTATVTIRVIPPVAPPGTPLVARDDYVELPAGTTAGLATPGVLGNDDGDGLRAVVVGNPLGRRVGLAGDGAVSVDARGLAAGEYRMTYAAVDVHGNRATATLTILVTAVTADPPSAEPDVVYGTSGYVSVEDEPGVLGNDSGLPALTAQRGTGGTLGADRWTLRGNGRVRLNAMGLAPGHYTGFYRAMDGAGRLTPATRITFVVLSADPPPVVDDAPFGRPDRYRLAPGTRLTVAPRRGVLANDRDEDPAALTARLVSSAGLPAGLLSAFRSDGSLVLDATTAREGTYTFTYEARDAADSSGPVTVTVVVDNGNECPQVRDDTYSVKEGTVFNLRAPGVLGNDTDREGNLARAALVGTFSQKDIALGTSGSVYLDARKAAPGTFRQFRYRGVDTFGESCGEATVRLDIVANEAPIAHPNSYQVGAGRKFTLPARGVLANDFDPDGREDGMRAQPGTLTLPGLALAGDGSFSWNVPRTARIGTVYTFNYRAKDVAGKLSNYAQVQLKVVSNPPPPFVAPVARSEQHVAHAGQIFRLTEDTGVLSNDYDPDGGDAIFVAQISPTDDITIARDGSLTLITTVADVGRTFTISYYVVDFHGLKSPTATVTIRVVAPRERCTDVTVNAQVNATTDDSFGHLAVADTAWRYCWNFLKVTRAGFVGPDGGFVSSLTGPGSVSSELDVDYVSLAEGVSFLSNFGLTLEPGDSPGFVNILGDASQAVLTMQPQWHSCLDAFELAELLAGPLKLAFSKLAKLPKVGDFVEQMREGGLNWTLDHVNTVNRYVDEVLGLLLQLDGDSIFGYELPEAVTEAIDLFRRAWSVHLLVEGVERRVPLNVAAAVLAFGGDVADGGACVEVGDYRDAAATFVVNGTRDGRIFDAYDELTVAGHFYPLAQITLLAQSPELRTDVELVEDTQVVGPDLSTD